MVAAPLAKIRLPVAVEPVKVIMSTSGLVVISSPTSGPPGMTFSTPAGMPASSAAWTMKNASSGGQGWGLSTTVQPAASAGATLTVFSMNGKLNGVIAPTTPTGSRAITLPDIPVGPPVGAPTASPHSSTCPTCAAFDRYMPIDPNPWMASVMNPTEPVSAVISSCSSCARDSRFSARRTSAAARSAGLVHFQGPSSKARRAAPMARGASFWLAPAPLPMTSSVAGSMTSIDESLSCQEPSMNSWYSHRATADPFLEQRLILEWDIIVGLARARRPPLPCRLSATLRRAPARAGLGWLDDAAGDLGVDDRGLVHPEGGQDRVGVAGELGRGPQFG